MYDKYGWIVNYDKVNKCVKDRGDSCFFMGLQALCFLLQNKPDKARELYERVKKYDFIRHPSILEDRHSDYYKKNQTSYDMMVIWDYVANRFKTFGIQEPPYHYRKSKFFWGRHRNRLMYCRIFGIIAGWIMKLILKTPFRDKFLMEHFKIHLFMLYLGTVYEKTKSKTVLKLLRSITKLCYHYLHYPNHFFYFISHMTPDEPWMRPIDNCHEWVYQRNLNLGCNKRHEEVEYHHEEVDINGKIKLDLSNQFWYFWVKNYITGGYTIPVDQNL